MNKVSELKWIAFGVAILLVGACVYNMSNLENKFEIIMLFFMGIIVFVVFLLQAKAQKRDKQTEILVRTVEKMRNTPKDEIENFSTSLAKVVSGSIQNSMFPVFEEINNGMKELIELFGKEYKDGISDIVDNFIVQMNNTMGKQFQSWGQNIDLLCKWQKNTAASTEKIAHNLIENTQKIETIYGYTENVIKQLDEYYSRLCGMQKDVLDTFNAMKNCKGMFDEVLGKQRDCVVDFNNHEKELVQICNEFRGLTTAYNGAINNSTRTYEELMAKQNERISVVYDDFERKFNKSVNDQIQINVKVAKTLQQLLDNSTNNLRDISKKYDKDIEGAINSTFENFDRSLATIVGHISKAVEDVNEITLNIPKAVNTSVGKMQKQLEKYIESIEEMRKVSIAATKNMQKKSD